MLYQLSYFRIVCFTSLIYTWAEMDSNHRSRTTADLQSAPFGHSGIRPCNENEPAAGTKVKIIFESAKIILPPCEIYPVPESVFRACLPDD